MATSHEFLSIEHIPEKPQKFPIEQLEAAFSTEDVTTVNFYQENTGMSELLRNPIPIDLALQRRPQVPLLTYNASRYDADMEEVIEADSIIKVIKTQQAGNEHDRVRALCARRSILVLIDHYIRIGQLSR